MLGEKSARHCGARGVEAFSPVALFSLGGVLVGEGSSFLFSSSSVVTMNR